MENGRRLPVRQWIGFGWLRHALHTWDVVVIGGTHGNNQEQTTQIAKLKDDAWYDAGQLNSVHTVSSCSICLFPTIQGRLRPMVSQHACRRWRKTQRSRQTVDRILHDRRRIWEIRLCWHRTDTWWLLYGRVICGPKRLLRVNNLFNIQCFSKQ